MKNLSAISRYRVHEKPKYMAPGKIIVLVIGVRLHRKNWYPGRKWYGESEYWVKYNIARHYIILLVI